MLLDSASMDVNFIKARHGQSFKNVLFARLLRRVYVQWIEKNSNSHLLYLDGIGRLA